MRNCEKLATLYTLRNNLYPETEQVGYSFSPAPVRDVIGEYGNSEFMLMISGKDSQEVWNLVDEIVTTVKMLKPSLYNAIIRRIEKM